MLTSIELENGEWSRFVSEFIDISEDYEYFNISDDEGKNDLNFELLFSIFFQKNNTFKKNVKQIINALRNRKKKKIST